MNNVNAEAMQAFAESVEKDAMQARKSKRVEGNWNFVEGKPQFSASIEFANGKTVLSADSPPFLGGHGLAPDPLQYCLFGLAACYASTFAAIATEQGLALDKLSIATENKVNLSQTLGLSQEPIVEQVSLTLSVSGKASRRQLEEINKLAGERCPGAYCLKNPIKLVTSIQ
ncbi:MAG TPA: OsmC family protein [Candidatus Diapherotrites archaeon]|uniref:OsmC family protein n=1 Tax=Candidatus Iainarchaeum sp. TaxID=3101447 RepID=A0A7J4JFA0_9ARCH|nr:OsmC family protein [Candidatus Diapherotrites archaeon]HIH16452.1 OsmC family protein [Candidatus Diapherotrites archaeon]